MKTLLEKLAIVYMAICTLIFSVMLLTIVTGGSIHAGAILDKMEQCEKSIPRDQQCVFVAVPKNGDAPSGHWAWEVADIPV